MVVAKRTKKKQKAAAAQPTPTELAEVGLMVANVKSARGQWSFATSADSWRAEIKQHLGAQSKLLKGCKRVPRPDDSRLLLRAPSHDAQVDLFSAIRCTRALRVFSVLTKQQLSTRKAARQYAHINGVRVVERGTKVGLCGMNEPTPADLPLISMNGSHHALKTGLDRLLGRLDARHGPFRRTPQPPPPPPRRPRQ